jgi:N-methylhydantoinase B
MTMQAEPRTTVDPVTAAIISHGIDAAVDQMLVALKRTAFSPIIYDVLDASGALYDRNFRMLSQMTTLPLFTGSLGLAIEAVVKSFEAKGGIQEGDVLVVNDPYLTGTHQWDVAVIVPGFLDGELVAYSAIKAHQLDVAALAPFVTESTDVFQEGVIYPGVKMWRAGVRDDDLYRLFLANTRLPDSAAGDLNAQAGACQTGIRALLELIGRYGLGTFEAAVEVILDAGEKTMRDRLAEFPNGRFTATAVHEHNGVELAMLDYEVAVEFSDGEILIDLTDAPDVQPGPVNAPYNGIVSAIRCAMLALAIRDSGRANEGYFRPLQLKTRPGSMFHAEKPAPCALASYPLYILVEGINEAVAQATPEELPSGFDMCVTLFMWGLDAAQQVWIDSVNIVGASPAAGTYGDAGGPLMPVPCSGVRSVSWEVIEAKTPIVVENTDFATDSAGAGRYRGGPGMEVVLRATREMDATIVNERSQVPPFALLGAHKGRRNQVLIRTPDGEATEYVKVTGVHVPEGSRIEMKLGGGPGHGPVADRDPAAVQADVAGGYVSEARARELYPHAF